MSAGCRESAPTASPKAMPVVPADAISKAVENGPVKAVVSVWPAAPSVLDLIYLHVEVTSATGTQATLELETELLTAFWQDTWQQATATRADGTTIQTKVAGLYAEFAGKQRIPSFRVAYVDAGGEAHELLTEEISLTVAPPPEDAATASMQPAPGNLDPARGAWPWWAWVVVGTLAIASAWLAWRAVAAARSARAREAQISAYDAARARLSELIARGAPDGQDLAVLDAWYVELSAIVRLYIEQRFGLRAPELTSEEFLVVAKESEALAGPQRTQLAAFLEACDRVKFAGYHPTSDESLGNFALAERFIEGTASGIEATLTVTSPATEGTP
ncbi:MAG: hypothetical protein IPL79_09775 [Myxococcales bacterium]|nr:hypothetical protein [Myxococcales bacterium]